MPELPEILSRAKEMKQNLLGRTITCVQVLQPKCLNVAEDEFRAGLESATIQDVDYHGKWIRVKTDRGWLLLNLGMGGEITLTSRDKLPEKYRLLFDFQDGASLAINFWWFGYAHYMPLNGLESHAPTAKLGPNAIDLPAEHLHKALKGQRGGIKAFLLDQSKIAGIGNAYIHDILFLAKLHPKRKIDSLRDDEIQTLSAAIERGLRPSIEMNGAFYETNLFGEKGGFPMEAILVGYREGQPCPTCGTTIEKIKTGSTSSFICPTCQPLDG
jgi:formamidopyrimidine-DNA glycosylase